MKKLTITTKREIPDEHWQEYKRQMSFLKIDFDVLEKTGAWIRTQSTADEVVNTIYELISVK